MKNGALFARARDLSSAFSEQQKEGERERKRPFLLVDHAIDFTHHMRLTIWPPFFI